jgi:hypothetical protein
MTTSKRQSHGKARNAGSEPNLGQKAAEREKKSKTQLSHMEGRRATGENRGSGWVDTTGESVNRAKARLAELDSLLTEKGKATISKP